MNSAFLKLTRPAAIVTALLSSAVIITSASADTYHWGQTTYSSGAIYAGDFGTAGNWFTDAAGLTVASVAPDALTDDLFFNTTPGNTVGGTINVNANVSAKSLTFNTTGNTILSQNGGTRSMSLGAGGITLGANSGAVTIGTGNFFHTRPTVSQTWTNNSSSRLTVRSLSSSSGAGAVTLTLNSVGTGGILFGQPITDSASDTLALVIDSTGDGSITTSSGNNTFRGGTTIKQGSLTANDSLGAGDVLLGDTTGSGNASLTVRSSIGFTNDITVRAGSSGTKTLSTNKTDGVVLGGTLTLEDSLVFNTITDGTLGGAISGTGNLVKGSSSLLTLSAVNTFSGDLTVDAGSLTLADTGSLTFYIGGNGETNQVNGVSADAVTFDGTFSFNLSGASLVDGNSWSIVTVANESYGTSFSITGFSEAGNIWTNGTGFSYSELTGVLSYTAVAVPEPSSFALLGGFFMLCFTVGQRRKVRATK